MQVRIALVVACLALSGACADSSRPYVDLSEGAGADDGRQAPSQPSFRVAVAGMRSPQATFEQYEDFLAYLGGELDRPVELVQRRTYAEINELIRTGDATLGFVDGGAYIQGQRAFGMELLAIPQIHEETTYYSYIIVPDESPARSLSDLRGQGFAFTDPLSNSGYLAPMLRLRQLGSTPNGFFSSTSYTHGHDTSLRAVVDHVVDAAAVDSLVYDEAVERSPDYRTKVRVVEKLGPYPNPPVVVPPGLNPGLKNRLRVVLFDMSRNQAGISALVRLRVDRFVTISASEYEGIRRAAVTVHGDGR